MMQILLWFYYFDTPCLDFELLFLEFCRNLLNVLKFCIHWNFSLFLFYFWNLYADPYCRWGRDWKWFPLEHGQLLLTEVLLTPWLPVLLRALSTRTCRLKSIVVNWYEASRRTSLTWISKLIISHLFSYFSAIRVWSMWQSFPMKFFIPSD